MKCLSCGKEFEEIFSFCPYCGKKVKKPNERKLLSNIQWLQFAERKDAESAFKDIKSMTTDEFLKWIYAKHDNVRVYQIMVRFTWGNNSEYKSSFYGRSVDETVDFLEERGISQIISVESKERNLSNMMAVDGCGVNWFRTKDECDAAVESVKKEISRKYNKQFHIEKLDKPILCDVVIPEEDKKAASCN